MNQVRLVTPYLSFGTRLITFDKDFKSNEPNYGQNILDAVAPFVHAHNGIALMFDTFRSKSTRLTSPDSLTEFEALQLTALIHARIGKPMTLSEFIPLSPTWTMEVAKTLDGPGLKQLLGSNGHSGIEQRYVSRAFYQFANMTLYTWLNQSNWLVDVKMATLAQVEEHLMRMEDAIVTVHSAAMLKMAVIAVMNTCLHALVCDVCDLETRVTEIVMRLLTSMEREVMTEEAPCGQRHLAIHSEFPGMTKINVPLRWKHLKVFDAPERRSAPDRNPGIGMRSIPMGYQHLIAYEAVEFAGMGSYFHVDIDRVLDPTTPERNLFDRGLVDAHVHMWVSPSGVAAVPIPANNPVMAAVIAAAPGSAVEAVHVKVPLLALIDGLTGLAIRVKTLANNVGQLSAEAWDEKMLEQVDDLYFTSKLPGVSSVNAALSGMDPRQKELLSYLIRVLLAGVTAITDIARWEFTQKYVTHQLECVKSQNFALKATKGAMGVYLEAVYKCIPAI